MKVAYDLANGPLKVTVEAYFIQMASATTPFMKNEIFSH